VQAVEEMGKALLVKVDIHNPGNYGDILKGPFNSKDQARSHVINFLNTYQFVDPLTLPGIKEKLQEEVWKIVKSYGKDDFDGYMANDWSEILNNLSPKFVEWELHEGDSPTDGVRKIFDEIEKEYYGKTVSENY
jgi:hypothetical protein